MYLHIRNSYGSSTFLKVDIKAYSNLLVTDAPITSWEIDGETVETVSDFIFLVSKIIADGDCNHEIKRRLLLGHSIPLGCPSAPAPSIQYHALNLDWQLISYMILYMFQSPYCSP